MGANVARRFSSTIRDGGARAPVLDVEFILFISQSLFTGATTFHSVAIFDN